MVKKKMINTKENETYILPTINDEMQLFIKKFRVDMMEHVISSIKFAIENKISVVEVFQFKNSPFVVTISENEFESNLQHINKFYMDNQIYELCPRVEQLRQILKTKLDEKETPDISRSDISEL